MPGGAEGSTCVVGENIFALSADVVLLPHCKTIIEGFFSSPQPLHQCNHNQGQNKKLGKRVSAWFLDLAKRKKDGMVLDFF